MLDVETLRAIQPVITACVFALAFFGTYLPTRAPYAGWWSASAASAGIGSITHLAIDSWGDLAIAVGDALTVGAAACVWGAARSLSGRRVAAWWLVPAPLIVAAIALVEAHGDVAGMPGTLAVILGTGGYLGLAAWSLRGLLRHRSLRRGPGTLHAARVAIEAMVASTSIIVVFYAVRAVVYVTLGPEHVLYTHWTGPEATIVTVMLFFVVVTYSVTELSHLDSSLRWRDRAMRDDLTGLLARGAFMDLAEEALLHASGGGRRLVLVAADFDHFKQLNDTYGHAEGDRALRAFGEACRGLLRDDDLAGRIGGEEFELLLAETDLAEARQVCERLVAAFARSYDDSAIAAPTVSFGVAVADPSIPLPALIARADAALYQAKEQGRDRVVIADSES
ncbi:GGDEF domain-containing protein [Demequina salsinemoris]|uniref:GGDEF domain-containing protein n=1 Tax=Demequina salsinemoris TaxID=577470 RepID=UPI00078383CB|nr:GGDEF domain-containing protein [Demequina salsinemoris]